MTHEGQCCSLDTVFQQFEQSAPHVGCAVAPSNPRLRVAYREDKNGAGTQLSARPSMRLNIYATRKLSFELEGGGEWQRNDMGTARDESWDYYVNVGYRLDF